jgi:hypothetical protein
MESLFRDRGAHTCFVLQLVQSLTSFGDLGNIVSHDSYCVVNLRLNSCSFCSSTRTGWVGGSTIAGEIWVVWFRPKPSDAQRRKSGDRKKKEQAVSLGL